MADNTNKIGEVSKKFKKRENDDKYHTSSSKVEDATTAGSSNTDLRPKGNKSLVHKRSEEMYGPGSLSYCCCSQKKMRLSIDYDETVDATEKNSEPSNEMEVNLSEISLASKPSSLVDNSFEQMEIDEYENINTDCCQNENRSSPIDIQNESDTAGHFEEITNRPLYGEDEGAVGFSYISNYKDENDPDYVPSLQCSDVLFAESNIKRDGNFFLNIVQLERRRLLSLIKESEFYLSQLVIFENDCFDDALGILRSTIGKATLLVSQKLKQFENLSMSSLTENPNNRFFATEDDLLGFWDTVKIQINDVNAKFKEIRTLKCNGWTAPQNFYGLEERTNTKCKISGRMASKATWARKNDDSKKTK